MALFKQSKKQYRSSYSRGSLVRWQATKMFEGNHGSIAIAKNPEFDKGAKHIDIPTISYMKSWNQAKLFWSIFRCKRCSQIS